MDEVVEVARLLAVRAAPDLPWCVPDPQRWAEAGAPGETAALTLSSYPREDGGRFPNYALAGCAVFLSLYYNPSRLKSNQALLCFRDGVSHPINHRRLEGVSRRLFEAHPELRVRVRPGDKRFGVPASPGLAPRGQEQFAAFKRERYPAVLALICNFFEGEGVVLAEPVILLNPRLEEMNG